MKIFIILVVSCCVSIPSKIVNADIGSDIDFEFYKHLDVSPILRSYDHDVDDFDDDHTTFDSTYDGGGSDIHDDNNDDDNDDNNNNQSGDIEKSKKSDENNSNVNGAKKNSADYDNNKNNDNDDDNDDDEGENNEGTENDDPNDNDDDNDDDGDDNNDDDDDDEEEKSDESKIKSTTIKAIDPKGTETVDPESFHYISPDDVSHRLSREKRSKKTDKSNPKKDYDFAHSYREFVQEHFGADDARTLSDNKKKQKKQQDDDENDNGEVEEDEDYEEGAEDGETADDDDDDVDDSKNNGSTASAPADEYYDDDDENNDSNDDDEDNDNQDDDNENDSDNTSDEDEDYKKVKKLSQDTDENPEFCKTVYKDNQECQVCRNPKTKDKSETCSYSSAPSPKRYAYKKEKNYNSNDDYGDPEDSDSEIIKPKKKSKKNKSKKQKSKNFDDDHSNGSTQKKTPKSKTKSKKHKKNKRSKENTESSVTGGFQPSYPYYHGYQDRRTTTPLQNHYFGDNRNDDLSFRASESLPVTASSETYETDIDIFKGRDWSQCSRKMNKEGLTCYYCKDAHGATQEECMYIAGNDDINPLSGKTKKQNNKNKKGKKTKRNNQSNRKSSIITTTTISSNHITTPTTTTRTTLIPKIITTTLRPYEYDIDNTKNINLKQQEDSNRFNINLNTAPTSSVSSVSWQTNHNYQQPINQQPRTLNRNQNFAITNIPIPILRQNFNTNPLRITVPYGSPSGSEHNIPNVPKSSDPVKTLEYTEPRNRETLKRMIKLRITNDHDSDKLPSSNSNGNNDATVFYSKVLRKF